MLAQYGQAPAVGFQLVDQQRQVGALVRRQLVGVQLAELVEPFVDEGQFLRARGGVGNGQLGGGVELADADAGFRIDAPQSGDELHGHRIHVAVIAILRGRRGDWRSHYCGGHRCCFGKLAVLAFRRRLRLRRRLGAAGGLGLGLGTRARRRQREAGQHEGERDFRFHHGICL
jgi:hypothetical protein